MNITTIDFETHAIESGAAKSPVPVGVAVQYDGEEGQYYAWAHPTNNNCSFEDAAKVLTSVWEKSPKILCHNAKFDIRVAMEHFGLKYPHGRVHDTMFYAFLNDPRERSLGLKDLADKYLDMPPDEQEEMRDWLVEHVKGATKKNFGKYIALAPGDLVGRYAVGDVERTYKLFQYFSKGGAA